MSSAAVTAVVGANVATLDLSSGTFLAGSVTLTANDQDAPGNESASVPLTNIVKDGPSPPSAACPTATA